jgi:branched-chain amino acid transport system ATP-binding protein
VAQLELDNVHVYYGNIHALKGISFQVEEGEVVALLGANGAGKTTTLRTISGLLRPQEGRVQLEGQPIDTLAPHAIVHKGIGHAPEGRRIFARLSVDENLKMGAYARTDQKGIAEDLDRVFRLFPRLKERINQVAGTLSGGEQQMLAIGRALMARPRVLLLDEPSMGLAPVLVEQIFDTIREINARRVTILLVEQNAAMALAIAHRGYVLETGSIALSGSAESLRENPQVRSAYLGEA